MEFEKLVYFVFDYVEEEKKGVFWPLCTKEYCQAVPDP
jgi:hypothetical protein